jgi:mono/diheme cytochrome c family protein
MNDPLQRGPAQAESRRRPGSERRSRVRPVAVWGFVACLAIAGCTARVTPPIMPMDESGGQLYVNMCASCHGRDGKGNGPVAPALRSHPTDLTLLAAQNDGIFPREEVIQTITGEHPLAAHGSREMPVWRERFSLDRNAATAAASLYVRRRLELLADYIESIQTPAKPPSGSR